MQLLLIKTSPAGNNPEFALLSKKQLQNRFAATDWKALRGQARGRKVVVLLPADQVVLSSANIPSKNRKQLLQAIPYALEDTLAEDIESLQFAVHQDSSTEDNTTNVAIINRNTLAQVQDLLRAKGITPHYVLPDLLAQKIEAEAWSLTYKQHPDETVSVRLADFTGFNCDSSLLDMFIEEALETQTPEKIYSNYSAEHLPQALQAIPLEHLDPQAVDYHSISRALPLNLLSNFIRNDGQGTNINWKPWRPAIALAATLASIWIGVFFWQNKQLQDQSKQLNAQINQVYQQTFPKGRIVDAAAQMNSALAKLKASAGQTTESPLPLMADVAPLLNNYKDLVLRELRYQENKLSLTIESPTLSRLEAFKRDAATKNNLNIEIGNSTTTANKVKAVLDVSALPTRAANSRVADIVGG